MSYTKKVWANNDEITAADLNRWENRVEEIKEEYSKYYSSERHCYCVDGINGFLMRDLIYLMDSGCIPIAILGESDSSYFIYCYYTHEIDGDTYYNTGPIFGNQYTCSGKINDIVYMYEIFS